MQNHHDTNQTTGGYDLYMEQMQTNYHTVQLPNKTTETIANMVIISAIIWLVIAIYQVIFGMVFLVFGIGGVTLVCGIWNIFSCIQNFKHAKFVQNLNDVESGRAMVRAYDKNLVNIILFLLLNLFFGGFFGVFGSIYDLILRSYVLDHKRDLGA